MRSSFFRLLIAFLKKPKKMKSFFKSKRKHPNNYKNMLADEIFEQLVVAICADIKSINKNKNKENVLSQGVLTELMYSCLPMYVNEKDEDKVNLEIMPHFHKQALVRAELRTKLTTAKKQLKFKLKLTTNAQELLDAIGADIKRSLPMGTLLELAISCVNTEYAMDQKEIMSCFHKQASVRTELRQLLAK
jgi:hypothetical protein